MIKIGEGIIHILAIFSVSKKGEGLFLFYSLNSLQYFGKKITWLDLSHMRLLKASVILHENMAAPL